MVKFIKITGDAAKVVFTVIVFLCPYHRQKKIEKEEEVKKRIINGSDKYKYPCTLT